MKVTDIEIATRALENKKSRYDLLFSYYDGEHPLIYNNAKLAEIFSGIDARFSENWCGVVVDSVLDRLQLLRPHITSETGQSTELVQVWEESGILEEIDLVHESLMVVGEAFLIVWPDESTGEPHAFWNDPRLCHAEYDYTNPKELRFAAKSWYDEEFIYMTLYYKDRIEYYRSRHGADPTVTDSLGRREMPQGRMFEPDPTTPTAANPFDEVPVFHFRRSRRKSTGDLASVIEIQDAVNKLFADMMVAAEYGAFRQRYVISASGIDDLTNGPNIIWDIPSGGPGEPQPQVGEFSAHDLGNYLKAIAQLASDIGIISRTPKHYFFSAGEVSGEALKTMEAPLIKKCRRITAQTIPIWRKVARFLLSLSDETSELETRSVQIEYDVMETMQPLTQAQTRQLSRAAGMPLKTLLRDEGWTDEELKELDDDLKDEQNAQAQFADQMMAAQAKFDQGQVQ